VQVSYFPIINFEVVQTIGKSNDANRVMETKLLRVVQNRESDISFINRIAKKFGLTFTVRGENMYFLLSYDVEKIYPIQDIIVYETSDIVAQSELNAQSSVAIKSYRLDDCAKNVKSGVDVRSNNPFTNEASIYRLDNDQTWAQYMVELINSYGLDSIRRIEDRLQVFEFVENEQQAELVASASLYSYVSKQVTGSMEMEGMPNIVAGVSFNVSGLGSLSGRYFVEKSRHRISRNGYTTNVEVRQLQSFESDPTS
jgi:phage protein D